jgi:hypothetical protein
MVFAGSTACANETSQDAPPPTVKSAPAKTQPSKPAKSKEQECGGQPCCGDPPQRCDKWIAEQRKKLGAIVVEQLTGADCIVFVDDKAWPEGKKLKAFQFVKPGMHTVECRATSGAPLFSRRLEVVVGKDTPLYWGP